MLSAYEVRSGSGLFVLPSSFPLGPLGMLPINAYLVKGKSPYLVDTGMIGDRDAFIAAVEALIDPKDLRLIFLTHTDPDHIGALHRFLARAPGAKLVTNFLSSAKLDVMSLSVPPDRLYLVNPGQQLELAGVRFTVTKPAVYDAPETVSFYDRDRDVLFSSDSFGAPLAKIVPFANDLAAEELAAKEAVWASVDAPWIHSIDRARFAQILEPFAQADPEWVCSSHLPPARKLIRTLCANLSKAPDAQPFVSPTQDEFQAMIAAAAAAVAPAPVELH